MIRTLTCRQVIAVLMDYVDGRLAASTRHGVEHHVKTCAPCRDFVRAYRATPDVVRRATGAARAEPSVRQLCARALKRRPTRS